MKFQLTLMSVVLMHTATYVNANAQQCVTDCMTNSPVTQAAATACSAKCLGTGALTGPAKCAADCMTNNPGDQAAATACGLKCLGTGGGTGGGTGNGNGNDNGNGNGNNNQQPTTTTPWVQQGSDLGPCCDDKTRWGGSAISHEKNGPLGSSSIQTLRQCMCGFGSTDESGYYLLEGGDGSADTGESRLLGRISNVGEYCSASSASVGNTWNSGFQNCEKKHDKAGPHSPEPKMCHCFAYLGSDPISLMCEAGQSCSNENGPLCSWPSATTEDIEEGNWPIIDFRVDSNTASNRVDVDGIKYLLEECPKSEVAAPWQGDDEKCSCRGEYIFEGVPHRCGQGSTCEEKGVGMNSKAMTCKCTPSDTQICEYTHKNQTKDTWTCPASCDASSKVLANSHRVGECVKYGRIGTGLHSTMYTTESIDETVYVEGGSKWGETAAVLMIKYETWPSSDCSGTASVSKVIRPGCQGDGARSFLVGEQTLAPTANADKAAAERAAAKEKAQARVITLQTAKALAATAVAAAEQALAACTTSLKLNPLFSFTNAGGDIVNLASCETLKTAVTTMQATLDDANNVLLSATSELAALDAASSAVTVTTSLAVAVVAAAAAMVV